MSGLRKITTDNSSDTNNEPSDKMFGTESESETNVGDKRKEAYDPHDKVTNNNEEPSRYIKRKKRSTNFFISDSDNTVQVNIDSNEEGNDINAPPHPLHNIYLQNENLLNSNQDDNQVAVDESTNFDSATEGDISNTHEDRDNDFPNLHLATLICNSEGEYDLSHPLNKDGFALFTLPENIVVPKTPTIGYKSVFNNVTPAHKSHGDGDQIKRYCKVIDAKENPEYLEFFESVCDVINNKLPMLPKLSSYMISALARKPECKHQVCHRQGKDGYFVLIPKTDDYELAVVPGSHINHHPELPKTYGKIEELNSDIYKMKRIVLKNGHVFLGRRNLVYAGGRSRKQTIRNRCFNDLCYHGHLVYSCLMNKTNNNNFEDKTTFVKFKNVTVFP